MGLLLMFIVLGFGIGCVYCQTIQDMFFTTDSATAFEEMTINVEEVDNALFIDVGRYSTIPFTYFNDMDAKGESESQICIDQYIRCLVSTSAHIPVCAFHTGIDGVNMATYCDVFLDNCRRGYRVWRVYSFGFCYDYLYVHDEYRRKNENPLIINLLKVLARQPGSTVMSISKNNLNKAYHSLGNLVAAANPKFDGSWPTQKE